MESRLSIFFYAKKTKKSRKTETNKLVIYLRATINGKRFEVSTNRSVERAKWSSAAGKMKGNSEEVRSINQHLDMVRQRVYDYQKIILREGDHFTKETLRN